MRQSDEVTSAAASAAAMMGAQVMKGPEAAVEEAPSRLACLALAVGRWARGVAFWFAVAVPLSPSVWMVGRFGGNCFALPFSAEDTVTCLAPGILWAPFYVLFGSLAHDAEDPPSPWPGVPITALLLAITFQALAAWKARRARGQAR